MIVYVLAMLAILVVAAAVVGLVLVGMEGRGRARIPRIAEKLTTAAKHLNGEMDAPESFSRVMERRRFGDRHQNREHTPAGR